MRLVNVLAKPPAGYNMSWQLVELATSISANYSEAKGAFSRDDFVIILVLRLKKHVKHAYGLILHKISK